MNLSNIRQIELKKLMKDDRQIMLLHANKTYLLSITQRGKLILTSAEEPKKT